MLEILGIPFYAGSGVNLSIWFWANLLTYLIRTSSLSRVWLLCLVREPGFWFWVSFWG